LGKVPDRVGSDPLAAGRAFLKPVSACGLDLKAGGQCDKRLGSQVKPPALGFDQGIQIRLFAPLSFFHIQDNIIPSHDFRLGRPAPENVGKFHGKPSLGLRERWQPLSSDRCSYWFEPNMTACRE